MKQMVPEVEQRKEVGRSHKDSGIRNFVANLSAGWAEMREGQLVAAETMMLRLCPGVHYSSGFCTHCLIDEMHCCEQPRVRLGPWMGWVCLLQHQELQEPRENLKSLQE